jgi:hypothetical protein
MPEFPGELTAVEQGEWIERFQAMARDRWGTQRAGEIPGALSETALAVGAMLKLDFVRDEPPGFYMGAHFDEANSEWKIG